MSIGGRKLYLRGVTYGTFRPGASDGEYAEPRRVAQDLAQMVEHGVNSVRTYTVPPGWLLDAAQAAGLSVLVGLPWEQHLAFLEEPNRARDILRRVRDGVRACAGHPAVLGYAVGNEIPASIVRWYGARRTEDFLRRLCAAAKDEDPAGLVTYVNYPSTEYLDLPFFDLVSFNVYLERQPDLEAYLARLQNIAGNRPLVLTEIGLDSRRNGLDRQAHAIAWQLRSAFEAGCAGAFVFAWTDEWHRGGSEIVDWDFGLVDRLRQPKPALTLVRDVFAEVPFATRAWPRVSVVVCTYNGARTLRDCCEGLRALDYPDIEVIVVDDGSTDCTAEIARSFGFRVISTENRGLSNARNTGLQAATGEIIAYTDDDARPDPHWLRYLATEFARREVAAVGGPNVAPPGDGLIAECVANAPGGPIHVLIGDRDAEHVPGCNMAFRREALEAIGGFDPRFRAAGDDVDVCWRLIEQGRSIGFSPAAMVWHHRRDSIRAYWNQQRGYGRAESLLEQKWPDKYNPLGHVSWSGRMYGPGLAYTVGWRPGLIHHGVWGQGLFQSIYQPRAGLLESLPAMPEWFLLLGSLALLGSLGLVWHPLLVGWLLLALGCGASALKATVDTARALRARPDYMRLRRRQRLVRLALVSLLAFLQPLARLVGRVEHGLTPWRLRGAGRLDWPRPCTLTAWCERWHPHDWRVAALERAIRGEGVAVHRGGEFDRWDLETRGGLLGAVRVLCLVEEHGQGKQLVRVRVWPRLSATGWVFSSVLGGLLTLAAVENAWRAAAALGLLAGLATWRTIRECAPGAVLRAWRRAAEDWT